MQSYRICKVLRVILWAVDRLMCLVTGYSVIRGSKEERSRSRNYETSAHVVQVLFRGHSLSSYEWEDNYCYIHCDYRHPLVVLEDNVSLLGVTKDTACFAIVPSRVNIYNSDIHPFLRGAQFDNLTHLVFMSIVSFHRVAVEIGDPKCQVIMLSHTGRCGSTLMSQCFEALPNTLAMSEPEPLLHALYMFNAGITSDEEHRNCVRSIIKVLCKEVNEKKIERILMKPHSKCCQLVYCISCVCRFVEYVFLYRNPEKYIISLVSAFKARPKTIQYHLAVNKPMPETGDYQWIREDDFSHQYSRYEMITRHWALICTCYLEYRRKGVVIKPFSYEELVEKPYETLLSLFRYLGIPQELIAQALTAFQRDSQRGTERSQDTLRKCRVSRFTPEELEEINGILLKFGFPSLGDFKPNIFDDIN